ncbi:hypothetical protein ACFO4O_01925 [Glaciecola siphonariae]|uniref:Uncharacterized protein n=1 Tax=Glaciecola siphonariae TaxID=521012 RepID=A0ABV9LQZ2_9ALTE
MDELKLSQTEQVSGGRTFFKPEILLTHVFIETPSFEYKGYAEPVPEPIHLR